MRFIRVLLIFSCINMKGVDDMGLWFKAMHVYNKSMAKDMWNIMTCGFSIFGFLAVMLGIAMVVIFNILFLLSVIATSIIFAVSILCAVPRGIIKYGPDWATYVTGYASGMASGIMEKIETIYKRVSESEEEG